MKKLAAVLFALIVLSLGASAVTDGGPPDPGNCPPGVHCGV